MKGTSHNAAWELLAWMTGCLRIDVTVADGKVRLRATEGTVPYHAVEQLKPLKAEVLELLAEGPTWRKRLEELLSGIPDADRREEAEYRFEERAAICEVEAGMSREDAEREAFEEVFWAEVEAESPAPVAIERRERAA